MGLLSTLHGHHACSVSCACAVGDNFGSQIMMTIMHLVRIPPFFSVPTICIFIMLKILK